MASRGGRWIGLGIDAVLWTAWCLVSAGPVVLILKVAETILRRADIVSNPVAAVAVEMLVLASTAFLLYRALARTDAPSWFWAVAPAGYLVSFGVYALIERAFNAVTLSLTPASLLEAASVSAVVAAAAWAGGIRRVSAPPAETGETPD